MVNKLFHYLHKEYSGLHEAAVLLALFMFLAQLLALWRDRLLAATFGASTTLDIYYAAFRLPDLVYVSIASFVSVTVLIPFISSRLDDKRSGEAKKFLAEVLTVFLVVMVTVSILLFLLMPFLTKKFLPGFSGENLQTLILLSRILLLSPILLGISNLFGSVTQAYHRFFVYSLSPILYNLGIIAGITFFFPRWGSVGLVIGVVLGAFLHAAIQLPTICRLGYSPRLTFRINWREIGGLVFVSFPRTLTLASGQLATFALVSLASLMASGSIAIFNFASNLQSVPLSIVGVSYSVAAFPTLSRSFRSGDRGPYLEQLAAAVRHIIFWSMPAMVMFIVLRAQVVRVILGSGQFSWADTRLVAAALAIFALSIAAQSLVLLFVRAYYAGGNTLRPLVINITSSIITILLAYGLVELFAIWPFGQRWLETLLRVGGLPNTTILTLPMAFSLGSILNLILLWFFFERDLGSFSTKVWRGLGQTFAAAVIGGFVAYLGLNWTVSFLDQNTFWGIFTQGLISGIFGLLATVLLLKLLGNRELEELSRTLSHKFWRARPIVPGPEEI